nr:MAG TPA: hypothetical protein [Caudoviricetes sp.]
MPIWVYYFLYSKLNFSYILLLCMVDTATDIAVSKYNHTLVGY